MPRLLRFLPLVVLSLTWCSCVAQKPKPSDYGIKNAKALSLFLEAKQNDEWRDYKKAVGLYQQAIELEPEFGEAHYGAGADFFALRKYKEAYPYLTKAKEIWKNPGPHLFFYLGEVAFNLEKYAESEQAYTQFFAMRPAVGINIINVAKVNQKKAAWAKEAIQNPVKFSPVNAGESINSLYEEYLAYLTADEQTMFFTARRSDCMGGYNSEYRGYTEDFYYSNFAESKWGESKNLGPPVNTDNNEGASCFTPDGQFVYFTACDRRGGLGSCDIYFSKLEGSKWSEPVNLGAPVNTAAWESQPYITHDGNTLFFCSSRSGGYGDDDIWYSRKVKGVWQTPVNLGPKINTAGKENGPFLHSDGVTLYFSSNFLPGFGGMDLFMSNKKDTSWSDAVNLGYPLNTSGHESNIFINAKGTTGYINSTREGGLGGDDIWYFELDPRIRPKFTTFVRGVVKEKGSGKPLQGVVTFINLATNDTIRRVLSNSYTGKFMLTLPVDQDYAAFVESKGYLYSSQNFSLKDTSLNMDTYYDLVIELEAPIIGATTVLRNVFFDSGRWELKPESKAELDHLIQYLKNNPKLKIEVAGHTDNVGKPQDNITLSQSRCASVKDYLVKGGIAENRMIPKGYGETRPVADNNTSAGRAINRRTEFTIIAVQ